MKGWGRIDAIWIAIGVLLIAAGVHLYCSRYSDAQAGVRRQEGIIVQLSPTSGGFRVAE